MPYFTKKFKNKTCVYEKDTGEKVGCTKGPIKKYLAALHMNEEMKLKNIMNLIVESSNFTNLSDNEINFLKTWARENRLNSILKKFISAEEIKIVNKLVKMGYLQSGISDDNKKSRIFYMDTDVYRKLG